LITKESDGTMYHELWYCPDCDSFYTEEYSFSHWEKLDDDHPMMSYLARDVENWIQLKRLEDLVE